MDNNKIDYAKVKSVLFVCLGNICRSPTAEAVFKGKAEQAGLTIDFDSAGTAAYHQGEQPDRRSAQAGAARGYSFDGMQARQFEPQDFDRFDLILAADEKNLADLRQLAKDESQYQKIGMMLQWGELPYSEVPDPYYGGSRGFELVLDLLEESAENLIERMKAAS